MKWQKIGLIISAQKLNLDWCQKGLLTPTPVLLNKNTIRVFAGFRDQLGVSRIGYVDVSSKDPSKILAVSQRPVLDIGKPGRFDDAGVILGHVIKIKNKFHMYYVGFQIPTKAKFLAFTGLSISKDLKNFERVGEVPILDRTEHGIFINALHSLVKYKNKFIGFVACGSGWEKINDLFYPKYEIYRVTSVDGVKFNQDYKLVVPNNKKNKEYRIGRPSVFLHARKYYMYFTKGTNSGKDYFPGLATSSSDLKVWKRDDSKLNLELGPDSFDNQHLCYPRYIETPYGIYLFYNGNNMGLEGIAAARLVEPSAR
jgi:predicted GH43/DUF377 family glycosyl hydrolase